ncbi:MAG: septation protein A [Rhodocyclaceae bacterium]|nr:septation protein A [Rhodocyclaceae bacterium]
MKFFFDLLPVILFFVAYKIAGANEADALELANGVLGGGIVASQAPILIATAIAIVATAAQIGWVWFRHGKVETMLWVSLVIVSVFGGATLFFHDPTFIKWKPTALYWLFAATLTGSALLFRRNLIRKLLEAQLSLPDEVWERLNLAWAGFFALMGVLNLVVAYQFEEATWVNFKLFGGMGLMLLFVVAQGAYLSRYMEDEKT